MRSEFGTQFNSFGNRFTANLTSQRNDTGLCFKSHAATITRIIDDVVTVSKNLSSLQETSLSKNDVEHIVVAKWQDELDPHIKSHYDFKTEASTRLDYLDHTLKDTVTMLQNSSKLTSTTTHHSSSTRSAGFHQATSKDFSVSKLQKELKDSSRVTPFVIWKYFGILFWEHLLLFVKLIKPTTIIEI